jgi:hypothetical protein
MEDILHEPVELSDQDLDKVAGGYPFSAIGFLNDFLSLLSRHNWIIGAVAHDFATATFVANSGNVGIQVRNTSIV